MIYCAHVPEQVGYTLTVNEIWHLGRDQFDNSSFTRRLCRITVVEGATPGLTEMVSIRSFGRGDKFMMVWPFA
jgi:hypothetical protein